MKIVKEILTKRHYYDEDGTHKILVEEIEQYHYDTEKEKLKHSKIMQENGFKDSGQVKENVSNSFMNPHYVWFGSYSRNKLTD